MIELDRKELDTLIRAVHNALWMSAHPAEMLRVDEHILVLDKDRAELMRNVLIDKLLPARDEPYAPVS